MLGAQPGSGRGGRASGGGLEDILGQVLGGGGSGADRDAAPGGGGLGDILGQVLGGAPGGGTGGRSAGGGGLGDILGQVLGGAGGGAGAGRSSGGGFNPGMGSLSGTALDNGSSPTRSMPSAPSFPTTPAEPSGRTAPGQAPAGMNDLVKYGGIAVLGMLAYKALRNWQASQGAAAAPSGGGFLPNQMPVSGEEFSNVLTQAMIAATQADGVVDEGEQQRLVGALQKLGASEEDRQAVASQLRRRVDPQSLVASAKTPEMGLEIYAASALAVTIDSPAERKYLDGLAASLGIDPGLKAHVEQAVGRG